jgi:DNA-binding NtrC family response regulator
VCVGNGSEAIDKFIKAREKGRPFKAVIMDLTIPGGMGGVEINQKLREIDTDVKTIVSSGYSNDPAMSEYTKYGFKGVIAKPYKIYEMSDVLFRVLNS